MAKKKMRAPNRPAFVLDCSVTMAWYFKDESEPYANLVRKSLSRCEAIVPSMWPLEVVNILVQGERRHRSSEADAHKWLGFLQKLPIRIDPETQGRAWSEILNIARSHTLSAYDAAYLELALRLGLPLASLDAPLKAAAASAGVPRFVP